MIIIIDNMELTKDECLVWQLVKENYGYGLRDHISPVDYKDMRSELDTLMRTEYCKGGMR